MNAKWYRHSVCVALLALVATSAQAANTRSWVSGKGVDHAGCDPVASPCRTLQFAHDNTSAGGEIDVLDAAGYGSLTITKSINIVNDGVGVAGVLATAGGTGITINTQSADKVLLRGLTIEGAGAGANGIAVLSVGTLDVANCVMQQFVDQNGGANNLGNGIIVAAMTGAPTIVLSNTTSTGNDYAGLLVDTPAGSTANVRLTLDRILTTHNHFGIAVRNRNNTRAVSHFVAISNSVVTENSGNGILVQGYAGQVVANVDSTLMSSNDTGIYVNGSNAKAYVGRSVATNNNFGLANNASVLNTYKNNQVDGNGVDILGTMTALTFK